MNIGEEGRTCLARAWWSKFGGIGEPPNCEQTTTSCQWQSYSRGYVQSEGGHGIIPCYGNGMAHRFRSRFVPDDFGKSTGPKVLGLQKF